MRLPPPPLRAGHSARSREEVNSGGGVMWGGGQGRAEEMLRGVGPAKIENVKAGGGMSGFYSFLPEYVYTVER